jgi:hypothetical protein
MRCPMIRNAFRFNLIVTQTGEFVIPVAYFISRHIKYAPAHPVAPTPNRAPPRRQRHRQRPTHHRVGLIIIARALRRGQTHRIRI